MSYQISIIVPVYNQEEYLRQCLDSIVSQTFGVDNIEVILVNDKSTDNSLSILEEYASKYPSFKIINHDVNKGLGEAKNTGMAHVTTDYVMFLDSDDFLSNTIVAEALEDIKDNDCDLLIFNWERYPVDEYSIHKPNIFENRVITSLAEKPNLIFATSSWGKVFRKNLFKYLKFPTTLYEDNISTLEAICNAKKAFLYRGVGIFYRKNENSITNEINIKNPLDLSGVIKNLSKLADEHPTQSKYIKALMLKFVDDVLFWIYYYDWLPNEELELIKVLQDATCEISKEDIDYLNSLSKFKVLYPEDILNLNKYDAEGFLGKYKYYLKLPRLNPVATLYVDCGEGFKEEDKISIQYELEKLNSLTFDLSKYDNIELLRFDPIEGEFIGCQIVDTTPETNRVKVNAKNTLFDEYQYFTTLDPSYLLDGDFKNIDSINIQFKLTILNKKELSDVTNKYN